MKDAGPTGAHSSPDDDGDSADGADGDAEFTFGPLGLPDSLDGHDSDPHIDGDGAGASDSFGPWDSESWPEGEPDGDAGGFEPSATLPPGEVDELIQNHLDYAKALALKIAVKLPDHVDRDELIAYAQLGLTQAAHRYRPDCGAAFSTFSYYRIRGAVFDGIRKATWMPPASLPGVQRDQIVDDLLEEGTIGGDPAATLDAVAEQFRRSIRALGAVFTFSQLSDSDDDETPEPAAEGDDTAELERQEMLERLRIALAALDAAERQLVEDLYIRGKSMGELAAETGINKSTICRRHAKLVERLRELLDPGGAP
jgi:RNA polymerase sigma factor for flagellar operon FliA